MTQKKKIVFFLSSFVVGGVEKSFLDLLDNIDREKYEITVFLPDDKGDWVDLLREKCEVKQFEILSFKTVVATELRSLHVWKEVKRLIFRVLCRVYYNSDYRRSREYLIRSMPVMSEEYDCAVAYQLLSEDCVLECLCCTNAKIKVGWMHGIYGLDERVTSGKRWYGEFDKVFCVSKAVENYFVSFFPELSSKTSVVHNSINPTSILRLSEARVSDFFKGKDITLVTVGRLSQEKGQSMIPRATRLLLDAGHSVKWYLIGDGSLREVIETEIKSQQVDDSVILLGSKDNPYPYIKHCDIYVQTSYTEGWGITVSEAKILNKPIVTTDAGVMTEQIANGVNGLIVTDATAEKLAAAVEYLIEKPDLQKKFVEQLEQENQKQRNEIVKLLSLMD